MGLLDALSTLGQNSTPAGVASSAAEGAAKGLLSGIRDLVSEFHMSPEDKAKADQALAEQELKLITLFQQIDSQQIAVNVEEAKSASVFVSGWRPFIGWMCGGTLSYIWIIRDLIAWGIQLFGSTITPPPLVMQDAVLELTLAMLGMAGLRTYEKYKGVHDK